MSTNVDTTEKEMPVIKAFWYSEGPGVWGHWSKVGEHRRTSKGKEYRSPRIILPSEYDAYIGRMFVPYHARIEIKIPFQKVVKDCIFLVFEDQK